MRLKVRRLTITNPNYNNNYTSHWQSISVIGVISLFVFQQSLWSNFKCPWEYILSNAQHETFQINFSNSQLRVIPLRYFPTEISPVSGTLFLGNEDARATLHRWLASHSSTETEVIVVARLRDIVRSVRNNSAQRGRMCLRNYVEAVRAAYKGKSNFIYLALHLDNKRARSQPDSSVTRMCKHVRLFNVLASKNHRFRRGVSLVNVNFADWERSQDVVESRTRVR